MSLERWENGVVKGLRVVFLLTLILQTEASSTVDIVWDPKAPHQVHTEETAVIRFNLSLNSSSELEFVQARLEAKPSDESLIRVLNTSLELGHLVPGDLKEVEVMVEGRFLGHAMVTFTLVDLNSTGEPLEWTYKMAILRTRTGQTLSDVFLWVMIALVVVNTFLMGTQLDLKIIKDCVKRPIGPAIGFGCQYLVMPLVSKPH